MSAAKARIAIAATFAVALVLNLGTLLLSATVQAISWSSFNAAIGKLVLAYSAPGSALVVGIFATRKSRVRSQPLPFWAAIGICALWNLLLVWRSVSFGLAALSPSASGGLTDFNEFFQTVSKGAAAPTAAVTYFFAKQE